MTTDPTPPEAEPASDEAPATSQVPSHVPAPAPRPGRGPELLHVAAPFYGVVVLFAFGYALFSGGLPDLFGEAAPTLPGLVGALGLGLALVVLARVGNRSWRPMTRLTEALAEWIGPIDLKTALLLALLSGGAEELLFRGALWPHLGLVGTTLLFGLVHFLPRRSLWIYPLFATLAGLLLGLLREGTQSLWPPMLAHVMVNALNLAWIGSLARRREVSGEE